MPERDFWLALSRVPGIGAKRLAGLVGTFGSARGVWEAAPAALEGCGLPAPVLGSLLKARREGDPEKAAIALARLGLSAVTLLDVGFPSELRSDPGSPPALFVRGDVACVSAPGVAVVGTRRPTHAGLEVTAEIAGDLAAAGLVIISGLALGIDAAAHRAALDAGGRTVAVLGSGHNHLYPAANDGLAREIVAHDGAVISQFDPDTIPEKGRFLVRNRVVAGLARGVVGTEAPLGSGALRTARHARSLGRVVMAVPGPVSNPAYGGCLELIREGARAVGNAAHVLADLGAPARARPAGEPDGPHGREDEPYGPADRAATVLDCLGPGEAVPFALLMARTGLSADSLGVALGLLEIRGLVSRQPGQNYARN
jgi:DNA processing protein